MVRLCHTALSLGLQLRHNFVVAWQTMSYAEAVRRGRAGMGAVIDGVERTVTGLHQAVFQASGGRLLGRVGLMPVVMLTTTGRKSGQPRTTMLSAPIHDDDRVVLVASRGGAPRHPAWYLNLQADPHVKITLGDTTRSMVARTATPLEKRDLWPTIVRAYPGYGLYQLRTKRDIPVVVLEPEETS
jgi:deazaflavin-dependent oxidoreductase (nitroreductase family)